VIGWAIVRMSDGAFWTGKTRLDFSPDELQALRLCRQADATIVRDWLLGAAGLDVVAHTWPA
jgi:hypothetical protein